MSVFNTLLDNKVKVLLDKDVITEEYFGCSDGTTTGYMKIRTNEIIGTFLNYAKHKAMIVH